MERLLILAAMVFTVQARISVMYAHDKLSDYIAEQCLTEMFPKAKHTDLQESDEACIIFCVLKKFGIMTSTGGINMDIYRKRVMVAHQMERVPLVDSGNTCLENTESMQHKQDVCKKAKLFNDCTHLYRILL